MTNAFPITASELRDALSPNLLATLPLSPEALRNPIPPAALFVILAFRPAVPDFMPRLAAHAYTLPADALLADRLAVTYVLGRALAAVVFALLRSGFVRRFSAGRGGAELAC